MSSLQRFDHPSRLDSFKSARAYQEGARTRSDSAPRYGATDISPQSSADGSGAASPHDSDAPVGLWSKGTAFLKLALYDPAYRRNMAAIATSEASTALANSAYLLSLQASGTAADVAAASMVMDFVRFSAAVLAMHERDNEDIVVTDEPPASLVAHLSQRIALHGVAETLLNVAFFGVLAGGGLRPENAVATRSVAIGVAVGKAYMSSRYLGLWSRLKVHLGNAEARAQQRDYNRTIGAFEYILFSLMSRTGGSALYLKLRDSAHGSPTALLAPAVGVMVGSGALSAVFNGNFIMQSGGQPHAPTPAPDARADLLTLRGKLRAFAHLLAHDPDYRSHAIALVMRRLGLGLGSAGYLHLVNACGTPAFVAGVGMVEDVALFVAYLVAHHERDNEDAAGIAHGVAARRAHLSRDLALCGVPYALSAAAVITGLALTAHGNKHPLAMLAILAVSKVADTYVRNREAGYWNCLKMHLGDDACRENQSAINRTIMVVEGTVLTFMLAGVSIGVYALLNVVGGQASPQAAYTCVGVAALGVVLAAAGSGYFAREAVRWSARDRKAQDRLLSETVPLLRSMTV